MHEKLRLDNTMIRELWHFTKEKGDFSCAICPIDMVLTSIIDYDRKINVDIGF